MAIETYAKMKQHKTYSSRKLLKKTFDQNYNKHAASPKLNTKETNELKDILVCFLHSHSSFVPSRYLLCLVRVAYSRLSIFNENCTHNNC